jgi:hypothetical protein
VFAPTTTGNSELHKRFAFRHSARPTNTEVRGVFTIVYKRHRSGLSVTSSFGGIPGALLNRTNVFLGLRVCSPAKQVCATRVRFWLSGKQRLSG